MIRSFQWDLARQVERLDWLVAQLPRYAEWGYDEVHLHLEDAVHYPRLPDVARKDAYSYRQLDRLMNAATRAGIRCVPIVNLLGHTQYLIKVPALRDLNELRGPDGTPLEVGQICPLHPQTLEVAEKLLRDIQPFCTAGKVHVGLDESYHLGKCPRCRAEISQIGLPTHFTNYVKRLQGVATKLDLRMGLWADMFYFIPEAIPLLPTNLTAYEWYYYPFDRVPRVELFNFAERDIATALKRRGLEYYGCPMNGAFRYEPMPAFQDRIANLQSWWRHSEHVGAAGFLVTSWEANRLAIELTTVVDAAAASLWLEPHIQDPLAMLRRGVERVFGRRHRSAAKRLIAADDFPFSGHFSWQVNDRWDTVAGRASLRPWIAAAKKLRSISTGDAPVAIRASLAFRSYLAERDVFVRHTSREVFSLRKKSSIRHLHRLETAAIEFERAIKQGARAARAMWLRSRASNAVSPNTSILEADARRLKNWQQWLRQCHRDPQHRFTANPFVGTWQIILRVRNTVPALQKIAIEQQNKLGEWETLHALSAIEFKAAAARRRTKIVHEMSTPLAGAPNQDDLPHLRIAARGFGQLAVKDVVVTNGVVTRHALNTSRWITLGERAPTNGFPVFDWTTNRGVLELAFAPAKALKKKGAPVPGGAR